MQYNIIVFIEILCICWWIIDYAHSVSFPWQPVVAAHDSKRSATEQQSSGS